MNGETRIDLGVRIEAEMPNPSYIDALETIDWLDDRGYLREPATPIDEDQIRKGDRYRAEYDVVGSGEPLIHYGGEAPSTVRKHYSVEQVHGGGTPRPMVFNRVRLENLTFFLIERPEEKQKLPTEPGATVQLRYHPWVRMNTGAWVSTDGSVLQHDQVQELADEHGFEVLS